MPPDVTLPGIQKSETAYPVSRYAAPPGTRVSRTTYCGVSLGVWPRESLLFPLLPRSWKDRSTRNVRGESLQEDNGCPLFIRRRMVSFAGPSGAASISQPSQYSPEWFLRKRHLQRTLPWQARSMAQPTRPRFG